MKSKTKFIPEGYHTATPSLIVKDATTAIEFYKQAFGAQELARLVDKNGKIAHAEIRIGNSPIMLADESPEWGSRGPHSVGGTAVNIVLYVEDVDAVTRQAIATGAKEVFPVSDQFYGDRSGRLTDPFGHVWIVATHKEDLSPQEMQRRFETWMKQQ